MDEKKGKTVVLGISHRAGYALYRWLKTVPVPQADEDLLVALRNELRDQLDLTEAEANASAERAAATSWRTKENSSAAQRVGSRIKGAKLDVSKGKARKARKVPEPSFDDLVPPPGKAAKKAEEPVIGDKVSQIKKLAEAEKKRTS